MCHHGGQRCFGHGGNESRGGGNFQTRKEKIFAMSGIRESIVEFCAPFSILRDRLN
jgi:hypothetical protein